MAKTLPTVEIVAPGNPDAKLRINATDFDPKRHVRWEDRDKVKKAPANKPPSPPKADGQPQDQGPADPESGSSKTDGGDTTGNTDKGGKSGKGGK